jgi:ribosome biogenesis GTPase
VNHIHVDFEDGQIKRDGLLDFGFDERFLGDYLAVAEPGDMPARVVEVQRGRYTAICRDSQGGIREVDARLSGRLSWEAGGADAAPADLPVVGDWIVLRRGGPEGADASDLSAQIRSILPRRTAFVRKAPGDVEYDKVEAQVLAANVDTTFIVTAAGRDWNPRRLERYLTLAWESGAEPVVVITKADLAEEPEALLSEARGIAIGARCVLVCAPEGRGLEDLSAWLRAGRTVVLLGSSGAGKSTLLNALAGRKLAKTTEVREDDQRGRHTTTHRQLYKLESGALVIDSPGMRELQLWSCEEDVNASFPDIAELASRCRFRDCKHASEPGCAVREALGSGALDRGRYESWRKLAREAAYLQYKENRIVREAEQRRWKAINKQMRGYSKERRALAGKSRG